MKVEDATVSKVWRQKVLAPIVMALMVPPEAAWLQISSSSLGEDAKAGECNGLTLKRLRVTKKAKAL